MNFLGRKLHGKFERDRLHRAGLPSHGWIPDKHRVKENWLRCTTSRDSFFGWKPSSTIPRNSGYGRSLAQGKPQTEWVAMRKGVAYLFRYREVSLQANGRYLDALAVVDPTNAKRDLDRVTTPKKDAAGRGCSGFNPLARHDAELFQSVMAGDHCLRGFKNCDIRARLASTGHLRAFGHDPIKQSAKVSRTFRRFHAHGLIAKVPRTRRWRVTLTDAASWELRSISGTTTSRRPIPESPHDILCQMQRSHGERLYPLLWGGKQLTNGVGDKPCGLL